MGGVRKKVIPAGTKKAVVNERVSAKRVLPSWLVHQVLMQSPLEEAAVQKSA
jgi:hypothetical protein